MSGELFQTLIQFIFLKGENCLEEIIICIVIDEARTINLELTCLDPCGNDPIMYTVGTNDGCTHSVHDVLIALMVYANEGVEIMLHHPSLREIKSWLSSSGSYEYHEKDSIAVIK